MSGHDDELPVSEDDLPLSDAQREEIERRLRRHEENPGTYSTLDDIKRKLGRGR